MQSQNHHAHMIEVAIGRSEAAKRPVVASWQRSSSLYGLSPEKMSPPERLNQHELKEAQERLGLLVSLSNPILDQLYLAVGNVGCNVILADKNGVAIARRGAVQDDDMFNEWGLWTGAIWSEESEGTNGIGTCIVEKRPLTIHKDQHFHSKNAGLSCTAAPIFDHDANLLAVIDVSSCRADLTENFSQLISVAVMDTARQIETGHFSKRFPDAQIQLVEPPVSPGKTPAPYKNTALIAVDENDLVIGATRGARDIFGLSDTDMKSPRALVSLQGKDTDLAQEYALAENRIIQQSLANSGGNISAAAREMGISRATLHRKLNKFGRHSG